MSARRRRRAPAPGPVVVATEIYAVEGELLATMDAVASRRVLKRDMKELTRLILVGGERKEFGPASIPNLDRIGSYAPPPVDYEAQAIARNAGGLTGAAKTYTRVGAVADGKPAIGTAKFVPTAAPAGTGPTGNGAGGNGAGGNGYAAAANGHGPGVNGTNGNAAVHGAVDRAPAPPAPAPVPPPAVPPTPPTPPAPPAVRAPAASTPAPPGPAPARTPATLPALPAMAVSRVIDGKVVPATSSAPEHPVEPDEELSGSALSAIDATALFGAFAVDAALGGSDSR